MAQLFSGKMLVSQDGSKVPAEQHLADKKTLLYFSAGWCGPCHRFTPLLKEFYDEAKAAGKQLEVVFVSWDRTSEEMDEYFKEVHGQWTHLEFDKEYFEKLTERFDVDGIPCLKLVRPDGAVTIEDCSDDLRPPRSGDDGRTCDVCHNEVETTWWQCTVCRPAYDLCLKCKTHFVLSQEHKFEEKQKRQPEKKTAAQIWDKWMDEYQKEN